MADKVWTATDLKIGPLKVSRNSDSIHVERRYQFLDDGGDVLTQIAGGRFVADIALVDLPGDVLSALQTIDAWTKDQALEQEGMA